MVEQEHLFDDGTEPPKTVERRAANRLPLSDRPNPMIAVNGPGPVATRCGDCASLVWKGGHGSRRFYGCKQRGPFTNGPGTDHLVRWPSCGLFEVAPR